MTRNLWTLPSPSFLSLLASVLLLLLAGCSATPPVVAPTAQDAAPETPIDVSSIPNAVPKLEPRSQLGNPPFYDVEGKRYYVLNSSKDYVQQGVASWYGTKFHGQSTSSGEPYDMYAMTAAHKSLPLPTYARVTNLDNQRTIVVRINDRGPFVKDRIIDLSYTAAKKLDILQEGTGRVEVRALSAFTETGRYQQETGTVSKNSLIANQLFIQVGAFSRIENAKKLQDQLTRTAFKDVHIKMVVQDTNTVYRVRIGPMSGEYEADRTSAALIANGHNNPRIVVD